MKALPACPSLYQINTRVWLTELSRGLGRPATLDDMPDAELDRVAGMGFKRACLSMRWVSCFLLLARWKPLRCRTTRKSQWAAVGI